MLGGHDYGESLEYLTSIIFVFVCFEKVANCNDYKLQVTQKFVKEVTAHMLPYWSHWLVS